MGHHCCSKQKVKRGLWSPEEDEKLVKYITTHGHGCWSSVPKQAGLQRCGKSCRLRWINYLRPDLKRGSFTAQEERVIIDVHRILGNRWAQIAKHLPGRTDNEVKNFWNSCIKKKLIAQGLDPKTHNLIPTSRPSYSTNAANLSQFHNPQTSTPPFTISSPSKSFEMKTNSMDMNPPVVTLPPSDLPMHGAMPICNYQYQDTSVLMSFKDQNSHTYASSSSLEHTNMSSTSFHQPAGFMDETCMWVDGVETFETSKQHEAVVPQQVNGQEQDHNLAGKVDFSGADHKVLEMDTSYNSAAFDIDMMESALMPCGMFCGSSSMEQLQWDC
ncbi:uncharacterized protein [Typha latifolia]|uniref:uncharacterized protein n=1 Tax=Typha latifolia TaxID=4733 RepID=UPI003C2FA5A0